MRLATIVLIAILMTGCNDTTQVKPYKTAKDILGNPDYLAISYGGYRHNSRDVQPTISEIKEDMNILYAMGIRIIRTYNVHYAEASNILKAIRQLKQEKPSFEMYVMLGAWIDCENAHTEHRNHFAENIENNTKEIETAVVLANDYQDIVKIISVGNEAMVKWAESYYVQPGIILKWVNYLQDLKEDDQLPKDLWITSSDNFASWGGGSEEYHVEDLNCLIKAVDYISMHTYPMHDTHYNPVFWNLSNEQATLPDIEQVHILMNKASEYAISQYNSVKKYMKSLGINKPIHIGETGWASCANELYGDSGSKATDEYKQALYYEAMRKWTNTNTISCFFFEAFNEPWKDAQNPGGSENNFGLFTVEGKAKYALWDLVDKGVFDGLKRNGNKIEKTHNGDKQNLLENVLTPNKQPQAVYE